MYVGHVGLGKAVFGVHWRYVEDCIAGLEKLIAACVEVMYNSNY